jgi:pimeloyl-ACP methyl ester carboxylesterase
MKKVLFLHGWSSDGGTKTIFMRSLGYHVTTPSLSDWSFTRAVAQAQAAYDELRPDVIVGASRGGAVAMNMDSGETPLILLAPAWRLWGTARSIKKNCTGIQSPCDEFVPFGERGSSG